MEAAAKYLQENQHKASIGQDALHCRQLAPWIGDMDIAAIYIGVLQPFIEHRLKVDNVKTRTVNYALQTVRRILNLAASEWIDGNGLTWLQVAPKIKLLKQLDARKPYPLSWEEQDALFARLPEHVRDLALFAVNTGCRERVIRSLRWEWEVPIPELDMSVFIVPAYEQDGDEMRRNVKNGEDRLVILNRIAQDIVERARGNHLEYVFAYKGKPISSSFNNFAWKRAVRETGIRVRVHDLKHTFGRRLRAAGVSFEDRQDLLGHKSHRITTHYSSAEIENLLKAANKVCDRSLCGTVISVVQKRSRQCPARDGEDEIGVICKLLKNWSW